MARSAPAARTSDSDEACQSDWVAIITIIQNMGRNVTSPAERSAQMASRKVRKPRADPIRAREGRPGYTGRMRTSMAEVFDRAGAFFMNRSPQHDAARRITRALDAERIPYAIAGAMAVNAHGHRRTTEDVDLLMTREGLAAFKARWIGRGWVDVFAGSKGMRDTESNVKIDVLIAGDFPGDGKPKPVVFPDPSVAEPSTDGYPVLPLRLLIELKLASAMTAAHRIQDYADAMNLIRVNALPRDYAVDPYVAEKYAEMWRNAQVREDS